MKTKILVILYVLVIAIGLSSHVIASGYNAEQSDVNTSTGYYYVYTDLVSRFVTNNYGISSSQISSIISEIDSYIWWRHCAYDSHYIWFPIYRFDTPYKYEQLYQIDASKMYIVVAPSYVIIQRITKGVYRVEYTIARTNNLFWAAPPLQGTPPSSDIIKRSDINNLNLMSQPPDGTRQRFAIILVPFGKLTGKGVVNWFWHITYFSYFFGEPPFILFGDDFVNGFIDSGTYVIITLDAAKDFEIMELLIQYPYDYGYTFLNYLRYMMRIAADQWSNPQRKLGFYPSIGFAARYPIVTENDYVDALPPSDRAILEHIGPIRIGSVNPPIFYNAYYPW